MTETGIKTQTDYLAGGFQYKVNELQFFPHPEGYVNVIDDKYNYVFNYTDHLGNIRLSYGVDPSTSTLKILEENHYYPFGLKHEGYNMDYKMYQKIQSGAIAIRLAAPLQPNYLYKYNGFELQNELELNWYDYKARNYDPAIGRWMNIDPLAEMSRRFSPYTYAMDNPMYFVDPDGMLATAFDDPGDKFKSAKDAAHDFAKQYNSFSIEYEAEISTIFYATQDENGEQYFSYTIPSIGAEGSVGQDLSSLDTGQEPVADGHTHGADRVVKIGSNKYYSNDNEFSEQDINVYNNENVNEDGTVGNVYGKEMVGYVATPNGGLLEYDPKKTYSESNKKDGAGNPIMQYNIPIFSDIPSDKGSKNLRLNNIPSDVTPNVLPKNFDPNVHKKRD